MKGIKKVCTETKHIPNGFHLQMMYDPKADKVFVGSLLGIGSYEEYENPDLIGCGDILAPISMFSIKTTIECHIWMNECRKAHPCPWAK